MRNDAEVFFADFKIAVTAPVTANKDGKLPECEKATYGFYKITAFTWNVFITSILVLHAHYHCKNKRKCCYSEGENVEVFHRLGRRSYRYCAGVDDQPSMTVNQA